MSASATANLPAARNRRTASRSSCATAKPCSVSASRTKIPATRGSLAAASRAITTSVTVGGGRNSRSIRSGTPAVSLRLGRQSAVKRMRLGSSCTSGIKRQAAMPPATSASSTSPPIVARKPTRRRRRRRKLQAALGSRRCRRLSVRSAAGGQDVAAARCANRRGVACLLDDPRKGVNTVVGRAAVSRAGPGIERDQVHLRRDILQQADELARVGVAVVDPVQHHVLERDRPSRRVAATGVEQGGDVPLSVQRHQLVAQLVTDGVQRDREANAEVRTQLLDPRDHARGRTVIRRRERFSPCSSMASRSAATVAS